MDRVIKKPDNLVEIFGTDSEDAEEAPPKKKKRSKKSKRKVREPSPVTDDSPDEKEPEAVTSSEYSE